jgi:hypothetical protein
MQLKAVSTTIRFHTHTLVYFNKRFNAAILAVNFYLKSTKAI